jgi:hypothetical protein
MAITEMANFSSAPVASATAVKRPAAEQGEFIAPVTTTRFQVQCNRPICDGHHIGRSHLSACCPLIGSRDPFNREGSMRKVYLFAAAAFILAAGFGGWAASTTHARVDAPRRSIAIDTIQLMKTAGNLPVEQFKDYSVLFY